MHYIIIEPMTSFVTSSQKTYISFECKCRMIYEIIATIQKVLNKV